MGGRKVQKKEVGNIDTSHPFTGRIVLATRGREAGRMFVVVGGGEARGRVFIADGRHRRIAQPKSKSERHIRIVCGGEELRTRICEQTLTDRDVRRAIFSAEKPPKGESDAEG